MLFRHLGNDVEQKKLLVHTLELRRKLGDDCQLAHTLTVLSDLNRLLGLTKEGIRQAREALAIFERIDHTIGQGDCLNRLTWLLFDDKQLDAAEDAGSRAINLLSDKGRDYTVIELHRILFQVHYSKGEKEKAIHHFNTAIEIASSREWHDQLFWIHFGMATLLREDRKYDDANAQIKQAQPHAGHGLYKLGRAMQLQAQVWNSQGRLEDAKSEAVRALENYEKAGATHDAKLCRVFLEKVERAIKPQPPGFQGELLETILHTLRLTSTSQREVLSSAPWRIVVESLTTNTSDTLFSNAVSSTLFIQGHLYYTASSRLFFSRSIQIAHTPPSSSLLSHNPCFSILAFVLDLV